MGAEWCWEDSVAWGAKEQVILIHPEETKLVKCCGTGNASSGSLLRKVSLKRLLMKGHYLGRFRRFRFRGFSFGSFQPLGVEFVFVAWKRTGTGKSLRRAAKNRAEKFWGIWVHYSMGDSLTSGLLRSLRLTRTATRTQLSLSKDSIKDNDFIEKLMLQYYTRALLRVTPSYTYDIHVRNFPYRKIVSRINDFCKVPQRYHRVISFSRNFRSKHEWITSGM